MSTAQELGTPPRNMVVGVNGHPINWGFTPVPVPEPPSPMNSDEPDSPYHTGVIAAVIAPVQIGGHVLPVARVLAF